MLTFLASLTAEQQAMIVAGLTFIIVWIVKKLWPQWAQNDLDKLTNFSRAAMAAFILAAVQNAGAWDWRKFLVAAILGVLGSGGLYNTQKAAVRLLKRWNG